MTSTIADMHRETDLKQIRKPAMNKPAMNKSECAPVSCDQVSTEGIEDLQQWLEARAREHQLTYLLAHAEDGVIWGRFDQGRLITADQAFPQLPKLRLATLQRCHIFSQAGEVLLWRSQNHWKARFIGNPNCDCIPEEQMLWGTHPARKKDGSEFEEKLGFTLVEDGSEGLRHAVPLPRKDIPFSSDKKLIRPLRLNVRHYIDYDKDGVARIAMSRLVDLEAVKS